MSVEKQLHVRTIGIDIIPDGTPFIELKLDLHFVDLETNQITQIVSNYGRIYKRITDLKPIPIDSIADDGFVNNLELMGLVTTAALTWVAIEHNTVINAQGNVVIL